MATILSLGELTAIKLTWSSWPIRTSVSMYGLYSQDYATLYRTQPNVRTCVDFLARNIAQLGLHVFRRVSDTDRQRLVDHPLALLLGQPLPPEMKVTRYRLMEALMSDLGIYFSAYWLKLRQDGALAGLLRIPPASVTVNGVLVPKSYLINIDGEENTYSPGDIVHLRGFNPENPVSGLSPLETLRRILAEEYESGMNREYFWQNAARKEGFIKRPATAPQWSDDARERFTSEFQEKHAGSENAGKTIVLEEGMEWQDASFSPQESEYLAGRKLTREECARAYHIPLPMVGILDHATFSNITEQHKNLYQDALGPWCTMIKEDIELQLLPDFTDSRGVYIEFNIQEKLRGSFEEQTTSLQSAVGRPWMTPNEARARMNLPSKGGDADELGIPLNIIVGGTPPAESAPEDNNPPAEGEPKGKGRSHANNPKSIGSNHPDLRERHQAKWVAMFARHYQRQEAAILSRVTPAISEPGKSDLGGVWWDEERWNTELSDNLMKMNNLSAMAWAELVIEQTGAEVDREVMEARMQVFLKKHSKMQAEYINDQTREKIREALLQADPMAALRDLFKAALAVWAFREAWTALTSILNFGALEGAMAAGLRKKQWQVNSKNPRDSHLRMDGETVGIRDLFSNGLRWPGDPRGDASQNANCMCTVNFLGGE